MSNPKENPGNNLVKHHLCRDEGDFEWQRSSAFVKVFTKSLFKPEEACGCAMLVQIIKPNGRVSIHSHQEDSFYYILSGFGWLYLGESVVEVGPGFGVYIPSWEQHGLDNRGADSLKYLEVKRWN